GDRIVAVGGERVRGAIDHLRQELDRGRVVSGGKFLDAETVELVELGPARGARAQRLGRDQIHQLGGARGQREARRAASQRGRIASGGLRGVGGLRAVVAARVLLWLVQHASSSPGGVHASSM